MDNNYNKNEFQCKLQKELCTCTIFCIIETPNYYQSKWTAKEIEIAQN